MSFFSFQDIISCVTGLFVLITMLLALELVTRVPDPPAPLPSTKDLIGEVKAAEGHVGILEGAVKNNQTRIANAAAGQMVTQAQVDALKGRVISLRGKNSDAATEVGRLQIALSSLQADVDKTKHIVDGLKIDEKKAQDELERAKRTHLTVLSGPKGSKMPLLVECSRTEIAVGQIPVDKIGQAVQALELARFNGQRVVQEFLGWARHRSKDSEYFVLLIRPDAVEHFGLLAGNLAEANFEIGWDVWTPDNALFPRK